MDTGASRTLLRRKEFLNICKDTRRQTILRPSVELCSLTGHALDVKGETELMEDQGGSVKVIVVDGLSHAAILVVDVLGKEAIINFEEQNLKWRHNDYPLQNYVSTQTPIESLGPSPPKIMGELIEKVVKEFESLFAAKGEKIGRHPVVEMKILTTGGPFRQRAYQAPLAKRHLIKEAVEEMLEDGIIRRSSSPYASPCLGKYAWCTWMTWLFGDVQRLNKQLTSNEYCNAFENGGLNYTLVSVLLVWRR